MNDELRGLDAWIEGRHLIHDPRSPYYEGPEGDEECPCGCGTENGPCRDYMLAGEADDRLAP